MKWKDHYDKQLKLFAVPCPIMHTAQTHTLSIFRTMDLLSFDIVECQWSPSIKWLYILVDFASKQKLKYVYACGSFYNTPKSWSKGMVDRGTVTRLLHDMFITKHKQCRSSSTHIAAAATTKLWLYLFKRCFGEIVYDYKRLNQIGTVNLSVIAST
ncbi:hypothetical protein BCV71DRAFT_235345 [Rhizopus microsporus]|uniref:Uncharacterized protein n=1 Tax=Rhizopus microsporus TaxID=58291 RepID=A0A1X0S0W1_RHIZD|nr:hypothetical protein BCV71DRAFT_235345 [Rhizopus microsporus]